MTRVPNALLGSGSPYLLQHAYNPVQWYPWGSEALEKAARENKLLIISIGYSSCHWCHVMEHESFEDEEVAAVMNKFFVSVKVDREERPDIDQIYMEAVQLMTGRGGWPCNVIALPDQRPVYGGTYFPKEQWRQVLLKIAAIYREEPARMESYAEELADALSRPARMITDSGSELADVDHRELLQNWSKHFDNEEGGPLRAPKFPLPDSYHYLLAAADYLDDSAVLDHVKLTLRKMALGGIYDQLGGGFARYSTDMLWKVPHFEKMLYDNAQLISLYAQAYRHHADPLYAHIIRQSIGFLLREMHAPAGGYYSALDADSEGVEGKYYTWTLDELSRELGDKFSLACDYFSFNEKGYWEHDVYIPLGCDDEERVAGKHNLSIDKLRQSINDIRSRLLSVREKRMRPGLDNKMLCSWNALLLKGLLDAAGALQSDEFLQMALRLAAFLRATFFRPDGRLLHSAIEKDGVVKADIPGFLEDYAFTIEAFMQLYAHTGDEQCLQVSESLLKITNDDFFDEGSGMYWFTSSGTERLIARKQEVQDNVIPSSNAMMAHNLLRWSKISGDMTMESRALMMLKVMQEEWVRATPWYSRWALVHFEAAVAGAELAVLGPDAPDIRRAFHAGFHPFVVFAASDKASQTALLKDRFVEGRNQIFICRNKTCLLPVVTWPEALSLLREDG